MSSRSFSLNQKYSALSHREKVTIFVTGLFLIGYLMVWFVILPLQNNYFRLEQQINNLKQQEVNSLNQINQVQKAQSRDYRSDLIKQEQALQKKTEIIDQQLQSINFSFVSPRKMPTVLQQLLHKNEKIKLVNFKVQPALPVNLQKEHKQKKNNLINTQLHSLDLNFYEHTMTLQIKGDYFSLLDYLKKLKKIKEKLILKSVNYQVEEHPMGKLTLTLSTVSSDDEFIEL